MHYIFILCAALFIPSIAGAEVSYEQMVNIPFVNGNLTVEEYINAVYLLSISIAAVLAVLKITIAGVKYIMSDVVTSKQDAKKDIQGALFGLVIVLAAVVILNTINPQLTYFDVLRTGYTGEAPDANPANAYARATQTVTGDCDSGSRVPTYRIVQTPNGTRAVLDGCVERLPNLNQDQLLVAQRYEAIMAEIASMSAAEQRTAEGQARLRQLQDDLNTLIRNGRNGRPSTDPASSGGICDGRDPGDVVVSSSVGSCPTGSVFREDVNDGTDSVSGVCVCPNT